MRITYEKNDFYAFYGVPEVVATYLRRSVPSTRRYFESDPRSRWLVHRDYVAASIQLAERSVNKIICDFNIAYVPDLELSAKLRVNLAAPTIAASYQIMFLHPSAPSVMVEAAWKTLAKLYHTDSSTGDRAKFIQLQQAYKVLKNGRNHSGAAS